MKTHIGGRGRITRPALAALLFCLTAATDQVRAVTLAVLPQKQVDTTMPPVTGTTFNATCATLQAQINAAAAADITKTHQVILAVGTCMGPFDLPARNGATGWVLIKGANFASLPPAGTRVQLSDGALMPKIIPRDGAGNGAAFNVKTNGQRYRIIGLELLPDAASGTFDWISAGQYAGADAPATNTGWLILDRILAHDDNPAHSSGRFVQAYQDLGTFALIDSHCSGIKQAGKELQCVASDSNSGPILISNSFLEAAGENFMFCGGIDPIDAAHHPQDITIVRNLVSVNPAWYAQGGGFTVKSLGEFKCGLRVLVEGNTFQNMPWDGGGWAHRLTPRNVNGPGTFVQLSDLTIRYNLYKNITNWLQMIPSDVAGAGASQGPTKHAQRWNIHDNLVYGLGWFCGGGAPCGISGAFLGGDGSAVACTDAPNCGFENMTIAHNTVDSIASDRFFGDVSIHNRNLDMRDNLVNVNNAWGFLATDLTNGFGTAALNLTWDATWTWVNNALAAIGNGDDRPYPAGNGNTYPASASVFKWTNPAAGDYTLQAGSPAKGAASDGTDQGVNFAAFNAARAGTAPPPPVVNVPPSNPKGFRLN